MGAGFASQGQLGMLAVDKCTCNVNHVLPKEMRQSLISSWQVMSVLIRYRTRFGWPTRRKVLINSQPQQDLRLHIRWMIRRDMSEVLNIESSSFEFPWSEDEFIRCLRQRNCIGMVAEYDQQVVGLMIYELHKTRLHILNFAVSSAHRRLGIGAQMVQKLVGKLSPQRRTKILLEVRETNLSAQLFFRNLGFCATNVLRDFYEDTTEDAYLMSYRYVSQPTEKFAPVNRISHLAG